MDAGDIVILSFYLGIILFFVFLFFLWKKLRKIAAKRKYLYIGIFTLIYLGLFSGLFFTNVIPGGTALIDAPASSPAPTIPENASPVPTSGSTISPTEKQAIDTWIEENDLNTYGDPKDSAYAGGTPLFDESTGEYIDKYEYIKKRHPDAPWNR